jgi:hypothetical protein
MRLEPGACSNATAEALGDIRNKGIFVDEEDLKFAGD